MRFLLLVFLIFSTQSAWTQPRKDDTATLKPLRLKDIVPAKSSGWVSDFEKVFTKGQVADLQKQLKAHEKATTNEIVIVTVNVDSAVAPALKQFEAYSRALMNKWGVGKKNMDNGVGIIFSVKRRMVRIEVGSGLGELLTDDESLQIINTRLLPEFKKGNYYKGVSDALASIIRQIKQSK